MHLFIRLLEKFIRPNMQKELLSEDGMRRKELIDQGILPKDVLERLKFGEIVRAQIMKENPGVKIHFYFLKNCILS